jgi:tRNA (guanine-N7-)-methyltransferase
MDEIIQSKLWRIATRRIFQTPHFLEVTWGEPLSTAQIFPDKDKYFLELGSGWGEVAVQLAKENPNIGFILLEKKPDRIRKTLKDLDKHGIENVRFLTANFNWFLTEFFQRDSFHEILLNFPDPWPKSKHHKHRSFDEDFPAKLAYLLKAGGRFRFASDFGAYGRQVIRILRNEGKALFSEPKYSFQRDGFPISYFEREKLEEKKSIYYIETYKL